MGECQGARPGLIELAAIRRVMRKRLASLLLESMRRYVILFQLPLKQRDSSRCFDTP